MESIAVPVSVNVEVRPVGADIGSLERAISGALSEVARQLWAEVIVALERSRVIASRSPGVTPHPYRLVQESEVVEAVAPLTREPRSSPDKRRGPPLAGRAS